MRDYRSLIYQWIKPLRKVKEFQEIAKVEDIEFLRLYGLSDRTLGNMFIEYADEDGISRLEKITGIYPDSGDTLDARRARLYLYWSEKEPYTESELRNRLITVCGDLSGFDIITDYPNYAIEIITRVGGYGVFDEIANMLDYFLPANLELNLHNELTEESSSGLFCGNPVATALVYTITNDLDAEYPLSEGVYLGNPVAHAMGVTNTNDIDVSYPVSSGIYTGSPVATAMLDTVTNDLDEDLVNTSSHYLGHIPNTATIVTTIS